MIICSKQREYYCFASLIPCFVWQYFCAYLKLIPRRLPIEFHSKSSSGGGSNNPAAIAENAMRVATSGSGELDVPTMKKYIQYCKAKCAPRLSEEAGDILASSYVKIRDDVRKRAMEVSQAEISAYSFFTPIA